MLRSPDEQKQRLGGREALPGWRIIPFFVRMVPQLNGAEPRALPDRPGR